MPGNRKEWRARKTVCRRRETKIALAARTGFANRDDCFGGTERSLTVNAAFGRRDSNAEINIPGFLDELSGPHWKLRVVMIVCDDWADAQQHAPGSNHLVNLPEIGKRLSSRLAVEILGKRLGRDAQGLNLVTFVLEFLFCLPEKFY